MKSGRNELNIRRMSIIIVTCENAYLVLATGNSEFDNTSKNVNIIDEEWLDL